MKAKVRKLIIFLVKLGIGLGIIGWLVHQQWDDLERVSQQEINFGLLVLALVVYYGCVLTSFVRWHLLLRSQNLPFRLRDAFRLGFIGYFFNVFIPGTIGGDLVKAVYVAREQSRRAVGVATVVFDRILGLYGMFCMAFIATLIFHKQAFSPEMQPVTWTIWGAFALGGIGLTVTFAAVWMKLGWLQKMTRWRVVGHTLGEVFKAIEVYRGRMGVIWIALAMSIWIHALLGASLTLIAAALPGQAPPIGQCFYICPIGLFVASVPITPAGLGILEDAWRRLFLLSGSPNGFIVALVYRVIVIVTTVPGFVYYLRGRPQIRQVMDQIEHEQAPNP